MQKNEMNVFLYQTDDGRVTVDVRFENETFWMTQKAMSELFDVQVPAITKHLKNIYDEEELDRNATTSKKEIVQIEGSREVTRSMDFYNLDAIIAVGYRVNSKKATRFRQWTTKVLREFMTKGFVLDDELQITDIFAEISVDYDKDNPLTRDFYAMVQNKFHYAITGHTAAEIIHDRVDSSHENMGLTTWKNSPGGRILKSDVGIAKNYLDEREIRRLERNVSGFFDYVEDLIEDEVLLKMEDFSKSIDEYLKFRRYKILTHKGKVSMQDAKDKAYSEYATFNKTQKINSDFEKQIAKIKG